LYFYEKSLEQSSAPVGWQLLALTMHSAKKPPFSQKMQYSQLAIMFGHSTPVAPKNNCPSVPGIPLHSLIHVIGTLWLSLQLRLSAIDMIEAQ
jgi:hypothetical protein